MTESTCMPDRTRRRIAFRRLITAVAMLSLVAIGLIYPFPMRGRLWGEIFNLAHAPTFFVALIGMVGFLDPPKIGLSKQFISLRELSFRQILLLTIGLLGIGLLGEYLQQFAGRNPSWGDVLANSTGLLAGLFWIAAVAESGIRKRLLSAGVVVMLTLISIPSALEAWDCVQQIRSFPQLASFERNHELGNWYRRHAHMERSSVWAVDGIFSAKITLLPADYSGAAMVWIPGDWTGFDTLSFALNNPNDRPLQLIAKVFDEAHATRGHEHYDRFHQTITVPANAETLVMISLRDVASAPRDRTMDLSRMSNIEIFGIDISQPVAFYADNFQLQKR